MGEALFASISSVFVGVAALSSAAAVLVALFGWRLRRPVLSLQRFSGEPPDAALVYGRDGMPSAWLRMRVRNKRGRLPARESEVSLVGIQRLERPRQDDLANLEAARTADRLAPNHEQLLVGYPLKWSDRPEHKADIAGGTERLLDVIYLPGPPERRHLRFPIWEGEDWWYDPAQPERKAPHRPDMRHHVYWPAYKIALALSCVDATPRFYSLEVEWNGAWPERDEDIWTHFKLSQPQRHRIWPPRRPW